MSKHRDLNLRCPPIVGQRSHSWMCSLVVVLLLLIGRPVTPMDQQPDVFLGLLEQGEELDSHGERQAIYRRVRIGFRSVGGDWRAMASRPSNWEDLQQWWRHFPARVSWTVAFDGRHVGSVATINPQQITKYADVGLHDLVESSTDVPRIGQPSLRFAGEMAVPTYRPLVVVSEPNYTDPARWKRVPHRVITEKRLLDAFRESVSDKPYQSEYSEAPEEGLAAISAQDITLVRAYRSSAGSTSGQYIAALALSQARAPWAYSPDVEPWAVRWFVLIPSGEVISLGAALDLVDAGDYNGDGCSEILFFKSSHNRDEYVLYWNDFRSRVNFGWMFH